MSLLKLSVQNETAALFSTLFYENQTFQGNYLPTENNEVFNQTESKPKKKAASKEKQKAKLQNPALKSGENKLKCEYCQVYLTDQSFLDQHKGTKKHRRNLRKWKEQHEGETIEDLGPPTSLSVRALPITDLSFGDSASFRSSVFNREKYEGCFGITNKDKEYVTKLAALLSLQLSFDEEIDDFYISVFNKKWLPYGDIVVEIVKQGKIEATYVVKCKHISSMRTTLRSFKDIITINKEFNKIKDLEKDKTWFAIFTTSQAPRKASKKNDSSDDEAPPKTPEKEEPPDQEADKTSNEEIFIVKEKKHLVMSVSKEEKAIFEVKSPDPGQFPIKLLLFTSQNVDDEKIIRILTGKFEDYPRKVAEEYKNYIRYWAKGELGGEYKLRKIDTVLKLAQFMLHEVITEPIVPGKHTRNSVDTYQTWNNIISGVDLTILKNHQSIMSKISDPIMKIIENIFDTTVTPSQMVKLNEQVVQSLDSEIKAYLFETVRNINEPIPLSKLYFPLWKADKIPMLIHDKVKWRDLVLKIICFLKEKGFKRGFIILSDDQVFINPNNDLAFINPNNDLGVVNPHKDLKCFKCLADIKEILDLSQFNIQVSNGPNITLEQICDKNQFFLKWVTPDVFLNISLGKCSIKGIGYKQVSKERNPLHLISTDDILQEIYQGIIQSEDNQEENKYIQFGRLRGMNPALFRTATLTE